MAFLLINGVPFPVRADSWSVDFDHYGDVMGRAVSGALLESRTGVKRVFRCRSTRLDRTLANAWRKFIEAQGHGWDFEDATFWPYSRTGQGYGLTGTFSRDAASPKWGASRLLVGLGSSFGADLEHRLHIPAGWSPTVHGWSILAHYHNGSTWADWLATGDVVVTRGASANPPGVTQYADGVAGSHGMGNVINVATTGTGSSGFVSVSGYSTAGGAANRYYDDLVFYPFQIPAEWVDDISADRAAQAYCLPPCVRLEGDAVDAEPIEVIGRVERAIQLGTVNANTAQFEAATYALEVVFAEV